jgi:hypothetical protein
MTHSAGSVTTPSIASNYVMASELYRYTGYFMYPRLILCTLYGAVDF